jgi:hypothetical protein
MAAIITETRLLINDPAGGSQQLTDQQIQDHLDDTREDINYERLVPAEKIINLGGLTTSTASVIWADYYSEYHWWESDCVLQFGQNFPVLTPLASDYIVGHWQFDSLTPFVDGTVPGQYPPVYITGKTYDINLAASTLWRFKAAALATAYDFTADGQTFHRSQQAPMCLKMADYYEKKARARTLTLVRDDLRDYQHQSQVPLLDSNHDLLFGESKP